MSPPLPSTALGLDLISRASPAARRSSAACRFSRRDPMPRILLFGHAPAEATGADETLVITDGQLPRDFAPAPLVADAGGRQAACEPAGLPLRAQHAAPGLVRSNSRLALAVLGRYPSPIEVRS